MGTMLKPADNLFFSGDHAAYNLNELAMEHCPMGIVVVSFQGEILFANAHARMIFAPEHAPHQDLSHLLKQVFDPFQLPLRVIKKTRQPVFGVEKQLERQDGRRLILSINASPIEENGQDPWAMTATLEDITERKFADEDREQMVKDRTEQSRQMEELNSALRVLLAQRERDKEEFEAKIISNLHSLVLPYLAKLSDSPMVGEQRMYLKVALANLADIFSTFSSTMAAKTYNFTPREIQVASLVRQGKTNKAIAELLRLSVRSVETHRRSIRKKLGLTGKNQNLRSYLSSLK
jgi:PAS domain S-box-containing protein